MSDDLEFEFRASEIRPGITLLHHRSSKWKTETIKLVFVGDLRRDLAARALGAYLLRHGHGHMKGMDRVSRFMQDLFGAHLGSFVTRSQGRHLLILRGSSVDARHVPGNHDPLARLLDYVSDLLSDPFLARRDFKEEDFTREQNNLLRAIAAQADNKAQYAHRRLLEEMFPDHPFGRPAFGQPREVAALARDIVAKEVRRLASEEPLFIYVVSPRTTGELKRVLKSRLKLNARAPFRRSRLKTPPLRKRARRIREHEDLTQARLAMGFRLEGYRPRQDAHAAVLADMLLGGVSSSRLFKEIREKRSLAYSVGSGIDPSTGVCVVSAGVDPEAMEQVEKLIKAQVRALAAGRFSQADLDPVHATIGQQLMGLSDSPDAMINFHLGQTLGGRRDKVPMEVFRRYQRVKLEQIQGIMKSMRLDCIYSLTPGKEIS